MNSFASDLNERMLERFVRDSSDMTTLDWICANTTIRGQRYTIDGYEFQEAIINDMHPQMAVRKCSQVGLTESQIRKSLAWTYRTRGVASIFTLPEEKLFKRISQTRIKPIVDKDRVFQLNSEGAVRSMGILQFGNSFMYITACTEGDATSTSADALFNDEVDLSDQQMLALFNSRLQNSQYKIIQRFSTPTFPMFGIDLDYQASDKHQYLCKCASCGAWNNPMFTREFIEIPGLPDRYETLVEIERTDLDDMDLRNAYVACRKCRRRLPLGAPSSREWVPEHPGRDYRGYQVSPFCRDLLDPKYIVDTLLKFKDRQFLRGFYNTVLGEPFSDGQIQLSEEDIKACMKGGAKTQVGRDIPCAVGIDVGQTCHIVVGDAAGNAIFEFLACPVDDLTTQIDRIFKEYNIVAGGIDRLPYTPTSEALRDHTRGIILPIEYSGTGPKIAEVKDKLTEEVTHLRMNRTSLIDAVAAPVRAHNISFYGYAHQDSVVLQHLRDMWRREEPEKPAKWEKLTNQDHYFHSLAFLKGGVLAKNYLEALNKEEERSEVSLNLVYTSGSNSDIDLVSRNRGSRHGSFDLY